MSLRAVALALAAVAAGLVLWLWPSRPKDPEAQIRALVARCVAGAEAHDVGPLDEALADDFRGPGGAPKREVKQLVAFQVLRSSDTVAIFTPSLDVTLEGADDAELDGTFLFTRSKAKSVEELGPGTVAAAYQVHASLERRGSDWKLVSVSYQQVEWP